MPPAATHVSVEEFHWRFACESGYEYWFGEVLPKGVPSWLHAILQGLLVEIFHEQGYYAGSEMELRISRDFQPRPDVAASLQLESTGFPTRPIDVVAEILSPDNAAGRVLEKCRHYGQLGIARIYVFDPVARSASQWDDGRAALEPIRTLTLTNGSTLAVDEIFARLDQRLTRVP